MEISLGILNKNHLFEDSSEFELKQLDDGDWRVTVDGEVVHEGEFAPFQVTITDD